MKRRNDRFFKVDVTCCPTTRSDEEFVQDGLSYSVTEMAEMVEKGLPVSSINNMALQDSQGTLHPTWDVPLEKQRGVDIADIWEAQQRSRSSIIAQRKKQREAAAAAASSTE